ncbi:isomerase [Actinoplanes sp. OR16]|uniref:nuclear transport factor 2 family protein n=1 Tax=Actinoplanes sp. OR16 TaxID=946334 RepID=UPI000F700ABB|nr:nuclear transport factor 2 family protein [Actinoplanes sp. OR16]BBH68483.1 isomerase [Actinoplanes sp. OR16]
MSDFDSVVDRYLAVWNETGATARRQLVDDLFAPDVRYVDPMASVAGRDALDGLIGAVQQRFPGLVFSRGAGAVDAHHDQGRFTWHLGPDGGEALVVGFDVAELDGEGRIVRVLGFLDRVPAA